MSVGPAPADQCAELGVLPKVRHNERTDRHHDELVTAREFQCRSGQSRRNALMPEERRHFGVIEHEGARQVVVVAEHGHTLLESSLEPVGRVVVLDWHVGDGVRRTCW